MKTDYQLFAVTTPGLEEVCAAELRALGCAEVRPEPGGVGFRGQFRELYLANLTLRTASRVLVRIGRVRCRDFPALFQKTLRLPWGRFIRPGAPLLVRASSHASRLVHTGRIAETVTAAVGHCLGSPPLDPVLAEQLVVARFEDDECLLSVDSSGELLHRRGYRTENLQAPLRETLAAGILMVLGWNGKSSLLDPMCGSGTIPIEAALLAANRAPGKDRRFAFMNWPHYRPGLWQALVKELTGRETPVSMVIHGSDIDSAALDMATANARRAGVSEFIRFDRKPMEVLSPPVSPGLLLCNPPYGKRLAKEENLGPLYRRLGDLLRGPCAAWQGAFLCPEPGLARATGLPLKEMAILAHGGLKVGLYLRSR
ncbi:MAG: class I SAM-dependent RNA methyltransferase [Desulfuromonadaceae bacterium]|nr:class I SAM-dependent RNA methyltransferase [Desulfuromonadaceae bacterium]